MAYQPNKKNQRTHELDPNKTNAPSEKLSDEDFLDFLTEKMFFLTLKRQHEKECKNKTSNHKHCNFLPFGNPSINIGRYQSTHPPTATRPPSRYENHQQRHYPTSPSPQARHENQQQRYPASSTSYQHPPDTPFSYPGRNPSTSTRRQHPSKRFQHPPPQHHQYHSKHQHQYHPTRSTNWYQLNQTPPRFQKPFSNPVDPTNPSNFHHSDSYQHMYPPNHPPHHPPWKRHRRGRGRHRAQNPSSMPHPSSWKNNLSSPNIDCPQNDPKADSESDNTSTSSKEEDFEDRTFFVSSSSGFVSSLAMSPSQRVGEDIKLPKFPKSFDPKRDDCIEFINEFVNYSTQWTVKHLDTKMLFMCLDLQHAFSKTKEYKEAFIQIVKEHDHKDFDTLAHHIVLFDSYFKEQTISHLTNQWLSNHCGCFLCHDWIRFSKSTLPRGFCKLIPASESNLRLFDVIHTKDCSCSKVQLKKISSNPKTRFGDSNQ